MAVKMRGRPYEGHAHQESRKAGFWGFWKLSPEIGGPDGELVYPDRGDRLDYEGEIAIVLGKRGADLKPTQLKEYVWGVTVLADWSIRAPREAPGGPLNFGFPKNFDTSCSLGPCIAVGEADATNIDIETLVNGERRQCFNTREMVFSFGEYLEHLSRDFTLYPGDIISGGTAAGTAADSSELLPDGRSVPERFLKPGDVVEMNSPRLSARCAPASSPRKNKPSSRRARPQVASSVKRVPALDRAAPAAKPPSSAMSLRRRIIR
jgi:2-keto-4-pentenoate hydratase/2-oxohepta-3-ene-1,7-dioic acid hydratase in catechol pathway